MSDSVSTIENAFWKHEVLGPTHVRNDERGRFVELLNDSTPWENVSHGQMKKGTVMGNHYHRYTRVFFFITRGRAKVDIIQVNTSERQTIWLEEDSGVIFEPWHSHAVRFVEDSSFVMGKSKKYDPANTDTYEFEVEESGE